MSLKSTFESLRHLLHHGPSLEPLYKELIDEIETLKSKVKALEDKAENKAHEFAEQLKIPQYIEPVVSHDEQLHANEAQEPQQAVEESKTDQSL